MFFTANSSASIHYRLTLVFKQPRKESTPRGRGFVRSPLEGGQKPALNSRGCWSNGVLE